MTPRAMALKLVMKLKAAMVSTTSVGAQPEKKFSTSPEPDTVKMKHTAVVSTKAITWFLVKGEIAAPMARKAPASSRRKMAKVLRIGLGSLGSGLGYAPKHLVEPAALDPDLGDRPIVLAGDLADLLDDEIAVAGECRQGIGVAIGIDGGDAG